MKLKMTPAFPSTHVKVTVRRFMADSRRLQGCWVISEKGEKISAGIMEKVSSISQVNGQRTAVDKTFSIQRFISFLKSIDKTASLYKGQVEHFISYFTAFSILYEIVVCLVGWIFGIITLKTIYKESSKMMEKVDKIDEKVAKFDEKELEKMMVKVVKIDEKVAKIDETVDKIEEKAVRIEEKLKAPLQPPASAQFRWPWPLVNTALKKDVSVGLNCR